MAGQFGRSLLALIVFCAAVPPAMATVYKYIDKNGNIVLTDQPTPGATIVPEHPVMTIPALKGDVLPTPAKKDDKVAYTITITNPPPNAIFYKQDGVIAIAVSVDPALKPGVMLQVLVDGEPYEGGVEIDTNSLERGAHSVAAKVIDAKGNVIAQGPSITFFIQQQHTNQAAHNSTGTGSSGK